MTVAELTARIQAVLGWRLGRYHDRVTGADEGSAVYAGNVPSEWEATGLEVTVEAPAPDNRPVHAGVVLPVAYHVRVIAHDGVSLTAVQTALRRLSQAFETTTPAFIPGNDDLGILQQYTLQVRS